MASINHFFKFLHTRYLMHHKGLTVVELMAAFLIFMAIIGAIYAILVVAKISWSAGGSKIVTQQKARGALDFMIQELRSASHAKISQEGRCIDFLVRGKGPVRYLFSDHEIKRTNKQGDSVDESPIILATDIEDLVFERERSTGPVQIRITSFKKEGFLGKKRTYTMLGNVNIRGR